MRRCLKIDRLKERKGVYEELLGELRQASQTRVSLSDADARRTKGPRGYMVGYNVQVAVDSKHDLIVAQDVVQDGTDFNKARFPFQPAHFPNELSPHSMLTPANT